ncbi:MAG: hypothetical protein JSW60_03225 [Thermoplasmatales archaeon]|nr:MAG: hypothetical protein JSW60_03225 [Thermoplasmatales archaeon]
MKLNLKTTVALLIIVVLIISSAYVIFFFYEKNVDNKPPTIDTITENLSGKKGDIITIYVTFSDDNNVTNATLYYRTANTIEWISKSILSGSVDISLNSKQNIYYYITVDDAAGNGPIGDPSVDGSTYYTITVFENGDNDDEYVRNVFVEEGSFTNCRYCPIVAEMLYELYSSGNYNFYYVTLIKANEKATNRLDNEYNLTGLPTVFIDGGYKVIMGGLHEKPEYAQAIRDAELRNVSKIKIEVTAEYDNNTDELISDVLVKNMDDETYDGLLRVYLTEKISRWSGPEGDPYHFGFLDYLINEEISIDTGENASYGVTKDISDLDPENLMVIAVIFNSEKKQGYSDPPNNKKPFNAYYADNVDGTELVEGGNLPPTVGFSLPEIGKLHILGKPTFKFIFHKNTILIGKTKLVANAEDDEGIEKVEFFINDKLVSEDTEEPYEYSFRKVKSFKHFVRKYTLSVIAYDNEGKTGTGSIEVIALIL